MTLAELLTELNALMRLTAAEADVARSRMVQARDDEVREELAENARNADRRRDLIQQVVRDLGGAPDLVGVAIDRIFTVARTQVLDQAQPVQQALLADLALEHQLRDRAAFARVLADTLDQREAVRLLDGVEAAHAAAIEWIETRLGEVALGGPAAIRPTPLQAAAAVGQRVATLPSRAAVAGTNRTLTVAARLGDRVGQRLGRTRDLAEAAEESIVAGRDAALRTAEQQAGRRGAGSTARTLHQVRADAGALDADELPIARYEAMNASRASQQVQRLGDAADVRAVLAFEQANRARSSVVTAAERRLEELASDAMS